MKQINDFISRSYYNIRTADAINDDGALDDGYCEVGDGSVSQIAAKLTNYRRRFVTCFFITFIILLLSPFVFNSLNVSVELIHRLDPFIEAFLYSIIYFYGGFPFYKKILTLFKDNDFSIFVKFVNLIDAALYLYGLIMVFDSNDDVVTLTIITFIDGLLLMRLINLKIYLMLQPKSSC
jgi:cation transport ATPase